MRDVKGLGHFVVCVANKQLLGINLRILIILSHMKQID